MAKYIELGISTSNDRYSLIKYYQDGRSPRVIKKGLTLEQAQEFCRDPQTSSLTAIGPNGCGGKEKRIKAFHEKQKHWFIGYNRA